MAHGVRATYDLHVQMRRARDARAKAAELRARAARAFADGVAVVSGTVARHGSSLRPPRAAAGSGSPTSLSTVFTGVGLSSVRRLVMQVATAAGLTGDALPDFVLAVQELMTNAVRHGGGWGRVRLGRTENLLICTVTDYGAGFRADPASVDAPAAVAEGGRGLFLVRRLTHSMRVNSGRFGAAVTVTMELPGAATGV